MRPTVCLILCALAATARAADDPAPEEPAHAPAAPRWFKGNLHTHTLWSDGNDYPEMVVDWYARRGYHFLALSDHNVLGQGTRWLPVETANQRAGQDGLARYRDRFGPTWVETRIRDGKEEVRLKPLGEYRTLFESPGQFLLIPGEEITDRFESKPIHMNASNLLELVPPQGGSSVVEVMRNNLEAVQEQARRLDRPILAHLNHPNFGYAITAEELAMVTKERFFEIYNGHPDVHHAGDDTHVGVERMWDIINTLRVGEMGVEPVFGLATDDSHNYFGEGGASPGRGWIMARAAFLTPEAILGAIDSGDFYASSGVVLRDVRYDPTSHALEIEIEPAGDATYTTRFVGTRSGYDRTRRPVEGADGKPLPVTQRYSDDVGRVLATVEGTTARYQLTGNELYVRAEVTSSEPPANPSFAGQKAQAWTQPVGWRERLVRAGAGAASERLLVPAIDGDWWPIAGNPDLGELSGAKQEPVDFAIWRAADGSWQLWSCIRNTHCGGKTRLFHRWEAASPTDRDWTPRGIALQADPNVGETAGGLQAPARRPDRGSLPYVLRRLAAHRPGREHGRQGVRPPPQPRGHLGTVRRGAGREHARPDGAAGRRPLDLLHNGVSGGKGAVYARVSQDGDPSSWGEPRIVASGGTAGDGPYSAECPHVIFKDGFYYLFRTQRYGPEAETRVYRSPDPLDFGIDDDRKLIATLPVAAPEIIEHEGQFYIAALNPGLDGIRVARLRWAEPGN